MFSNCNAVRLFSIDVSTASAMESHSGINRGGLRDLCKPHHLNEFGIHERHNWYEALHRPGAEEMRFLRRLIESRPVLSRNPDSELGTNAFDGPDHISAARGHGYARL